MGNPSTHQNTQLLVARNRGDQAASDAWAPLFPGPKRKELSRDA